PLEFYERLRLATPDERAELVLSLVSSHPEHRLELPAREGRGAMLDGVDLSDEALEKRLRDAPEAGPPAWWNPQKRCANVRRADLWGARLEKAELGSANLQRATLREANLAGADLSAARLRGATLQKANLQAACLKGADLRGTELQGANFHDAVLREARLQ